MLYTQNIMLKRISSMTHTKRLTSYIENLILEKATRTSDAYELSFHMLDEHEQGNLVTLLLECDGRDTTECFTESQHDVMNDNITISLLELLKNDTVYNRNVFASHVRNNTIKKFESRLQEYIDEQCNDLFWSETA